MLIISARSGANGPEYIEEKGLFPDTLSEEIDFKPSTTVNLKNFGKKN